MSAKTTELEGTTVMLTLRNAVDQTRKVAIEVPAGSTVRDAAIEAGIVQGESFDVFTAEGRTVTRDSVEDHGDDVLYVGPQKVAGGAMEVDEVPRKAIHFAHSIDPSVRSDVVPGDGQTVRQAAEVAGLSPRDGSPWDVFDYLGNVVNDLPAADMIGESLYVGPEAIKAGAMALSELKGARCDYPSLSRVKGHFDDAEAELLAVRIPDNKGRSEGGPFRCVIDVRRNPPRFFVLNIREGMRHPRVYSTDKIPGTSIESHVVCRGSFTAPMAVPFTSEWLLSHLNHTASIMNE